MCDHDDIPIEVDHLAYLSTLDENELCDLTHHVEHLHEDATSMIESPMHEGKIPRGKIQFDSSKHFRTVNKAAQDLEKGSIDRATFQTKVKQATFDSYEAAYSKGKGVKVSELTDGDREYLRRAVETELGYLDGFADDLEAGTVGKGGKWTRQKRAQAYADSIEGIAWHGNVEANAPDESTLIDWVLGVAEHCEDCLLLSANSPYTRLTLPTTPRAGSTACRCITDPTARVLTKRGPVAVVDVVVGDEVLTHRGRWRRVTGVSRSRPLKHHRQAAVKAPTGRVVGFTTEHEFWSSGWVALERLAKTDLPMYTVGHELLKLWDEDQKRCDGRPVSGLQTDLPNMWSEEGSQGCRVQIVRYASQDKIAVGGPILQEEDPWGDCCQCQEAQTEKNRSEIGAFPYQEDGRQDVCQLLGRRPQADAVSLSVDLGASQRSYLRGHGCSSQERGPCRRQVGEFGVDGERGTRRSTHHGGIKSSMDRWSSGVGVPGMRQEIPDVLSGGRGRSEVLFSEVRQRGPVKSDRSGLFGVRKEVRTEDVGTQKEHWEEVLLASVLQHDPWLHDIEVEDDHSFVVEGLVVHNSRCKCHLGYKAGKKGADAAELEYKKDATLSELMKPPVPAGMRRPNDDEQTHIDNLRTKMNYQRRRIAREQENIRNAKTKAELAAAQGRLQDAISLRKGYNYQLNEFADKNDIFETPVFSVDDIVTEKDLGRRARRDIARHGLDGASLSMLDAKAASRLLTWYEEQVGGNLSDKAIGAAIGEAVKDKAAPHKINFIAVPYALRGKSDRVDYNLVAEDLQHTFWLLAKAAKAAIGTGVAVGPFDDEVLARVGLWVDGDPDEVEQVFKKMRGG